MDVFDRKIQDAFESRDIITNICLQRNVKTHIALGVKCDKIPLHKYRWRKYIPENIRI